jgi:hypothetical protein
MAAASDLAPYKSAYAELLVPGRLLLAAGGTLGRGALVAMVIHSSPARVFFLHCFGRKESIA